MLIKKVYYSITDVSTELDLQSHVLRYWESEFSQLRPKKNSAGNRMFREKDIELIKKIKFLLYDEKYTIQGAKQKISKDKDFTPELENNQELTSQKKEILQEAKESLLKLSNQIDDIFLKDR